MRITIRGTVQGVGFRPFVHRLASRLGLSGSVCNSCDGVTIEAQGDRSSTEIFVEQLRSEAPPLAVVLAVDVSTISPTNQTDFCILSSSQQEQSQVLLPPDVATCEICLQEMSTPSDRRYRYPFINCTDCGPRYTIVESLPYDRCRTTMAAFALCQDCQAEYEGMSSRRFHAQPIACPVCGPRVRLVDDRDRPLPCNDPIRRTIELLEQGEIGAIKGLGGFHLACDASREDAVNRLRQRKQRPHRPLAVMVRDLEAARRLACISDAEAELLSGWQRPIVLLPAEATSPLTPQVSGEASSWVGIMLPYTPLHHLLMEGRYPALVMTSGNLSDEPILHDNESALKRLGAVADFFLVNDRPIHMRADDSVVRWMDRGPCLLRRSRGWVPQPILLPASGPSVLAVGGDLKSACCLTRHALAICSQHIGDLAHPDAARLLETSVSHLRSLLAISPSLVVHDLQPDYHSTRFAEELSSLPRLAVQHHHAHALSCLVDNGRTDRILALSLDGTGYGTDGHVWGGELLLVDGLRCERRAHLAYLPMPGGDRAAREPWRMALSALLFAFDGTILDELRQLPPFGAVDSAVSEAVLGLAARQGACPLTSSTGRLFDAVASLIGLCQQMTFEGQAAMTLEQCAEGADGDEVLPFKLHEQQIDLGPAVRRMARLRLRGASPPRLARTFHNTLAAALIEQVTRERQLTGIEVVALSGGVLQNRILSHLLVQGLERAGFEVLVHRQVPPNDGGLCLGQAWAGHLHLKQAT